MDHENKTPNSTYVDHLLYCVDYGEPSWCDLFKLQAHYTQCQSYGSETDHLVITKAVKQVARQNGQVSRWGHVQNSL